MRHLLLAFCLLLAVFGHQQAHAQFTITGPETICTGSSATLTAANCGGTLQWSTGATTASITVSPAVTTTYYVVCTVGSTKTTGSLSPIVVPGLQLNSNVGTCFTDQATLSVPGVPIGSNLRWERDGVLIPGAGSNNYTATQPGTYTVKSDIPTSAWTWQNLLPDGEDFYDIYFATDLLGVAVGDYGKIMRTTDGGQTWDRIESPTAGKYNLRSVHFTSSNMGWISGFDNILLKTTNGGVTWNRVYIDSSYKTLSTIFFTDSNHGWILDNFTGSVLKTTNGGITWTASYTLNNYLNDIFFADALNGWLTVGQEVKRTTNGGSTWNTVLTATEFQSFYKTFFLNTQEGWAVGRRGLHKTTNGGITWTDYSSAVPFGLEFRDVHFSDANHGTIVSAGGIYRTTNGGSSWNLTNAAPIDPLSVFVRSADKAWVAGRGGRVLTGSQLLSSYEWKTTLGFGIGAGASAISQRIALDFVNENVGWAGNGNDFLLKTTSGGKVWKKTTLKDVYEVDFLDENTGYAVAKGISSFPASVYKSTDGGNTWTAKYNFASGSSPKIQFVNSNVGWVVNASNEIYRTTDGGNSWTSSSTGIFLQDLFFADALHGWVSGSNGQAARTTDGGITWTSMNVGTNFIESFYFKNQNEGWSTGLNTRKTIDGGVTWTSNLYGGETLRFRSMDFSDANSGFALGYDPESNGGYPVYKTLDGGSSWIKQSIPTHTQFMELSFPDATNGWISDGRGAIMHYAAPIATCAASLTLQQSPPAPAVTVSTHNALCEGESITLTASGCQGSTLGWSDGSTGTSITVTPYASTSYTAFCDTGNGCKAATYTGVAVIPKIRLDTAFLAACNRPFITASNLWPGIDLRWLKDGSVVPDQFGTRLSAASPGSYTAEPNIAGAWASQTGTFTNDHLNDISFATPAIGFAVGNSGAILKTSDGGTGWKTLPSGVTTDFSRVVTASPQVVWAFGIYGGLIKTTDGGDNWVKQDLGSISDFTDLSFANENVGWALNNIGAIYHTSNGGATWVVQPADATQSYRAIHAVDASTAFAVSYRKISSTTDGGANWTTVDSPGNSPLTDVYFTDATHGWAVGGPTIIHTEDGGITWTVQTPAPSPLGYWYFAQVQFVDTMNGWIRDFNNHIMTTNDGGQTWKVMPGLNSYSSTLAQRFFMKTPTEGFVVGYQSLLARTTDGADTFQRVGNVLQSKTLNRIQFVSNSTGFAVGAEGRLLKTNNGGKNWRISTIPHTGSWSTTEVFFLDAQHGWIFGFSGSLYRTTDGGQSWTQSQPTSSSSFLVGAYFINSATGWAVGSNGKILKTTDGGINWTSQTSNTTKYLTNVFFLDANRGWAVGNEGAFLTTTDGGSTWTSQNTNLPTPYLRSVVFTSPTNGWMIGSPYNLFRTTDGGLSWQEVQLDGELNYFVTYKVQFVNESTGFVLRDRFVYVTKDGGATWQKTYQHNNHLDMSFTDATHGWVIGEQGSILAYHPAAAPCPSAPVVVAPQSAEPVSTLASGNWDNPNVWSCGVVPTSLDDVCINGEHTITLPGGYPGKVKSVDLRGQIQYGTNAALQMGQE